MLRWVPDDADFILQHHGSQVTAPMAAALALYLRYSFVPGPAPEQKEDHKAWRAEVLHRTLSEQR